MYMNSQYHSHIHVCMSQQINNITNYCYVCDKENACIRFDHIHYDKIENYYRKRIS